MNRKKIVEFNFSENLICERDGIYLLITPYIRILNSDWFTVSVFYADFSQLRNFYSCRGICMKNMPFLPSAMVFAKTYMPFLPSRGLSRQTSFESV